VSGRRTVTYGAARGPSRPGARAAWVLAALICTVAGGAVIWIGSGTTERHSTSPIHRAVEPRPTRDGAVRAAVSALYRLSIPALLDRRRFEAELRDVAGPRATGRVRASFGAAEPAMLAAFAERPRVLRGAPLGYRIDRYTRRSADIAIWSVAVAGTRRYGIQVQWRTLNVELVWTAAGWKVAGGSGRAGPIPAGRAQRLARSTSNFQALRHVP
jgi:hypothetical protein